MYIVRDLFNDYNVIIVIKFTHPLRTVPRPNTTIALYWVDRLGVPMAKKRRIIEKKAQEEYEFVPPEFDEEEFIRKDLYGTKVILVIAVFSVIIGILCSCLQKMLIDMGNSSAGIYLSLLLLFLGVAAIKPMLKLLRFNPDLLEKKTNVGNALFYLLLALGIWILMVNPPFY